MSEIRAIIVDDESGARRSLKSMLEKYCPNVSVQAEADNINDGFVVINRYRPDVVFLDIQLDTDQGFDLLNKFEQRNFHVIFTTAYSQFGVRAIKERAIDYLVKPIDIDELIVAVSRVPGKKEEQTKSAKRLILPTNSGHEVIELENILYCEADNNYTNLYLKGGKKVVVSKTLKNIEEQLDQKTFFRTHRSFVVNLNQVQLVGKGKDATVTLKNGDEIYISRDRKEGLINHLGEL